MTQQMKVKAKFDNWLNLDSATKSLVNFFMSDAGLYMYGNYQYTPAIKASFMYTEQTSPESILIILRGEATEAGTSGNRLSLSFYKDASKVTVQLSDSGTPVFKYEKSYTQYDDSISAYDIDNATNALDSETKGSDFFWLEGNMPLADISDDSSNPTVFNFTGGIDAVDGGIDGIKASILQNHRTFTLTENDDAEYISLWIPYTSTAITDDVDVVSNICSIPDVASTLTQATSNLYLSKYTYQETGGGSGSGSGGSGSGSGSGGSDSGSGSGDLLPGIEQESIANVSNTSLINSMSAAAKYNYLVSGTSLDKSVTIKPYIGDVINTDSSLYPSGIMPGVSKINVDFSIGEDDRIDFQLRTSSFTVEDEDSQKHNSMYYRIGIYPLGDNTVDDIKGLLITDSEHNDGRRLATGLVYPYNGNTVFRLINSFNDSADTFYVESNFDNGTSYNFPLKAIFPCRENYFSDYNAILYMQLCESNGTPASSVGEINGIEVSLDGETWEMADHHGNDNQAALDIVELTEENKTSFIPVSIN